MKDTSFFDQVVRDMFGMEDEELCCEGCMTWDQTNKINPCCSIEALRRANEEVKK